MPLLGMLPQYCRHEDARCCKCDGILQEHRCNPDTFVQKEEFMAWCPECKMWTYYNWSRVTWKQK